MKYTIENLASEIADLITFEDGEEQKLDLEIELDSCVAHVEGFAYSMEEKSGGVVLDSTDLLICELVHNDDSPNTLFDNMELINLEKTVKLWK